MLCLFATLMKHIVTLLLSLFILLSPYCIAMTTQAPHEVAKMYSALANKNGNTMEKYQADFKKSMEDNEGFWAEKANEILDWMSPFQKVCQGTFDKGDIAWFVGGKLNLCYNAIDRHVMNGKGDQVAMIWEGDEPDDTRLITYQELLNEVSQITNALKAQGVRKGDVVTIYMPMVPELAMTMLACARMGAIHSVVFAGFSSEALAARISAAQSRFVVTADQGVRGGRAIHLKKIVHDALNKMDCNEVVEKVMVWERFYKPDSEEAPYEMDAKDVRMDPLVAVQRPYCPPEVMDSEDSLFLLYTSGSTGKPKGLAHTTGGYGLFAAYTTKTTFDIVEGDKFACVADCGWITGHTYVVYGPLLIGSCTFLFESTPVYPDPGRYWDMIQRHKITQFYTAPTAIRLLMRYGDETPGKYDLSSVRVLGTVGEPINPEAWWWYYEVVGKKKCTVVDTYWQTETGGHVVTNLPGVIDMKPGSCTLPVPGIDAIVLSAVDGHPLTDADKDEKGNIEGVMAIRRPWPGMARTCLGDHQRYLTTYFKPYPGYYFTGDSVVKDKDGYYWIIGRVDDVINVSGHRIGTAEVESALVSHPAVAQAAVVGEPHEIKGQQICAFCMLTNGYEESPELIKELRMAVRTGVGAFAAPDHVIIAPTLPMTRSGKIMRRILRKIVSNEADQLGDTSTLADPSIVEALIEKFADLKAAAAKK